MKTTMRFVAPNGDIVEKDITDVFDIIFGETANRITVRIQDGHVEVTANFPIIVRPRAANVVWVDVDTDRRWK